MAFIFKHQIFHLFPNRAEVFNQVARLALDHPRIILPLDDKHWTGNVLNIGAGRPFLQEISIGNRISQGNAVVWFPGFRDALGKCNQVKGTKHIHGSLPQFRVPRCQRKGHIPAVGTPYHPGPFYIQALVAGQLFHGFNMIQAVTAAPVFIHLLGVTQPVTRAAAHIGYKDGKSVERQELNQRHGKP